ncbi:MAG: 50S ribosomal protein L15e [Candidatus Micrarchaeota archaeon]
MGAINYIKESFEKGYKERSELYKQRVRAWRKGETVSPVAKPTNIARARELGYKAKQGIITVRVRVLKGMRKRIKPGGGRKPSKAGRFFSPKRSHQAIAEQRASTKYPNLEVLNSYWVGEDGQVKFFEVILADPILNKNMLALTRRGRAFRGLTSAGRKARALV